MQQHATLNIGAVNYLTVREVLPFGFLLKLQKQHDSDDDSESIFLPSSDAKQEFTLDAAVEAFVYYAQDGSLQATMRKMPISVGQRALLKVTGVTDFGAFFDWGLERDLLVPRAQQHRPLDEGLSYVVHLVHNARDGKLTGSTKLHHFLSETSEQYHVGQAVETVVYDESGLGFKATVNDSHIGLFYHSDLFKRLSIGDTQTAYIKALREDGKIDLSLQKLGKAGVQDLASQILEDLEAHGGISTLTDKSPAEEILQRFNVSKAAYKRAIGKLYKEQKISLSKTHIKRV